MISQLDEILFRFLRLSKKNNRRTTSRVLAPSGGQSSLTFGILPTPVVKTPPIVIDEDVKNDTITTLEQTSVVTNVISGTFRQTT
jgi:hypothetical protein